MSLRNRRMLLERKKTTELLSNISPSFMAMNEGQSPQRRRDEDVVLQKAAENNIDWTCE